MNMSSQTEFHSVDEEWLASYSAGGLSRAKRLLISCQAALRPELSSRLSAMDAVGGALLQSAQGEAVSDGFLSRVMDKLDASPAPVAQDAKDDAQTEPSARPAWMPSPLEDFLSRAGIDLKWKKLGFGVERASLSTENDEELYLLKARPGLKVPQHSHKGEEWALILQGGYHVGETGYGLGDLHREDEDCTHMPIVDDHGEACITLVALEGKLKFSNPVMRMLRPIIGI
ncbi:anti-ECFsigma factor, ChrR [Parasphingorhabdus marina DSM 22363]|uniref:Anti-ECFsigma factor, ChrR n=1 Tax=Parasphingorhabdus marina DSM 22363 TaxID=1123272 RepID=A0A1N6H7R6_9SPHN|nr:ChrR family anti-sigma-E factor [Parasphingorhabdus marina]SIO15806.1 anti-ECFsigma factor, ChrR [Parasphingorhabdus marina DSM 22363]